MTGTAFDRIVCGVDGSPESLEAVRQASTLLEAEGGLVLVAAVDPESAIRFQVAPTPWHAARHALEEVERLDEAAVAALDQACDALVTRFEAGVETVTVTEGRPGRVLVEAAAAADLLVVGSRGTRPALGLGSVSEHVAHHARCSVLVVRGDAAAREA